MTEISTSRMLVFSIILTTAYCWLEESQPATYHDDDTSLHMPKVTWYDTVHQASKRYLPFRGYASRNSQSSRANQRVRYRLIPGHGFMGKRSSAESMDQGLSEYDRAIIMQELSSKLNNMEHNLSLLKNTLLMKEASDDDILSVNDNTRQTEPQQLMKYFHRTWKSRT